jgi:serine/threonine-protein kinase
MAEVFEAELTGELGFARKVAIKRMLADAATDGDAARRFLDEARIASRLHHASIVAVLDVGLLDGLPFQVLELVDGLNVEQLLGRAGGRLPVEIALAIAVEVAHALDHAHAATDEAGASLGIVHRDVKPSNVLVAWSGDVKLSDFGIAVARDREARTQVGHITGTRGFMSPEQRTRGLVDDRSDVFSLGLTLHAMIAGDSPMVEPSAELRAVSGERLELDPSIPDDVRGVLDAALAPARIERPSAHQLADSIGRVLAQRLDRDGRTALREFVEPLRTGSTKRGVLDQLLGLEVVAAEPSAAAVEVPRFELRETLAKTIAKTINERPRRNRAAPIVVVALALVGVAGVVAWRMTASPVVAVVAVDAAPPVALVAPIDATVALLDAAVAIVPPADAGVAHVHHRAVDAGVAAPAPIGVGYLQVTGENAIGSKLLVDGVARGYPPGKIEVPRGHHVIALELRDGTTLPAKAIDITDLDTLVHPLRVSW